MKQNLTTEWWRDDGSNVLEEHRDYLQDEVYEHIPKMIAEGYTSGDLHATIDDIEYHGWWSMASED